jgi:hypothetical protein
VFVSFLTYDWNNTQTDRQTNKAITLFMFHTLVILIQWPYFSVLMVLSGGVKRENLVVPGESCYPLSASTRNLIILCVFWERESYRQKLLSWIWRCIQKFLNWVNNEKTTTVNTYWEATQKVMVGKLTKLTHKIVIQLHLVAESCTICSSHSRWPFQKLLDTPSYVKEVFYLTMSD